MSPKKGDLVEVVLDGGRSYIGTVLTRTFSWATMSDRYQVKLLEPHSQIVYSCTPDQLTVIA